MRNNETGEFELVLGNKQLLSGFFIVIILFGVFFAMGYIVGRNSSPSPRAANAESAGLPAMPQLSQPQAAPPPTQAEQQPGQGEAAQPPTETAPQPATQAAQEPEAAAAAPAPVPAPAAPAGEPMPGETYLQVMAVKRPEADVVLRTLKDKGFPALLGPGPNDLVRVLVGPFKDTAALGSAKANLENAGFHPIVRK